jgi:hypothetical protein
MTIRTEIIDEQFDTSYLPVLVIKIMFLLVILHKLSINFLLEYNKHTY